MRKRYKKLAEQIRGFNNIEDTVKKRKKGIEKSVDFLNSIIVEGAISDTHLRMLAEEIIIYGNNGRLNVRISLKGEFRRYFDYCNEDDEVADRIAELWYFPA